MMPRRLIVLLALMPAVAVLHAAGLPDELAQARELLRAGKTKQATQALERTLERFPDSVQAWGAQSEATCRMAQEASVFTQLGWAGDCLAALQRFQQLAPDSPEANNGLLQFYLQAPGIAGGGRDKAEALVATMRTRAASLGHYGGYMLAQADKREADALTALEAAVQADPMQPLYRISLAAVLGAQSRWEDARVQLQALLGINPDHPMAHYQLGRIAALSGEQVDAGIAYLDRFLSLPDRPTAFDAGAWWRKGQLLEKQSDRAAAMAAFARAVALNPKLAEAQLDLERIRKTP